MSQKRKYLELMIYLLIILLLMWLSTFIQEKDNRRGELRRQTWSIDYQLTH